MPKTVVVTGASGRIGRFISEFLIEKGYSVRSVVQGKEHLLMLPPGTIPYMGDINNRKVMDQACDGADALLHFAAVVSEYRFTTEQILNTNVVGTRTVLDACRENGVKKILFPSTVDVYGRERREKLNEESELKPTDKYGYSKMLAENVIRQESGTVAYTIFRLATAYGPRFEHSFYKVLRLIQDGKAYLIGAGGNHLALVHVSDIAQAFLLALDKQASNNNVYNISDGGNYTQKYLLELNARLLGVPRPAKQISPIVMNVMARTRGIDSDELRFLTSNRIIDITKARTELGFNPKVDIDKGAQEVVEEFLEKQRYATMRSII